MVAVSCPVLLASLTLSCVRSWGPVTHSVCTSLRPQASCLRVVCARRTSRAPRKPGPRHSASGQRECQQGLAVHPGAGQALHWVLGGPHCPRHVFQPRARPLAAAASPQPDTRGCSLGSAELASGKRWAPAALFVASEGWKAVHVHLIRVDPILCVRHSPADTGDMQKTGCSGLHSCRNGDGRLQVSCEVQAQYRAEGVGSARWWGHVSSGVSTGTGGAMGCCQDQTWEDRRPVWRFEA